jgi:hypothetical protein
MEALGCSQPCGAAVGAGIVNALAGSVRMQDHRAGVPHRIGVGFRQNLDIVTGG